METSEKVSQHSFMCLFFSTHCSDSHNHTPVDVVDTQQLSFPDTDLWVSLWTESEPLQDEVMLKIKVGLQFASETVSSF